MIYKPNFGGPKTPQGKRIAARNATSHGLFARDVVLTHLGEDPEGYNALLAELTTQIKPANLLERHYTEKIAAASWRLRRLHRWQAQLFEDRTLTEDEVLLRLDRCATRPPCTARLTPASGCWAATCPSCSSSAPARRRCPWSR